MWEVEMLPGLGNIFLEKREFKFGDEKNNKGDISQLV